MSQDVIVDGKQIKLEPGDSVSFEPFNSIYYTVYGFDKFSTNAIICVVEGTDLVSRHLLELASVIKSSVTDDVIERPTKVRKVSRIEQALKENIEDV